jgi:hypothetical protein
MDFASKNDQEQFQRRLTETIAWCALQDLSSHPAEKLRSPQLRPPEITVSGRAIFEKPRPLAHSEMMAIENTETKRQWQQNVEQLGMKRAALLQVQGLSRLQLKYPLAGGCLLVYNPDESTSDGVANVATQGFINDDNEPAWDTWISYVKGDPVNGTRYYQPFDSYLLSWVPDPLIEVVQHGMDCNSDNCQHWITDLASPFIQQLRQTGLIM